MTTRESILSRLTKGVSGTDQELFSKDELSKFADFYRDKWDENTSEDVIAVEKPRDFDPFGQAGFAHLWLQYD